MTRQELLKEVTDIKLAIEARERELKMEYMFWDEKIRRARADNPDLPNWQENAEQARRRRGREPNAMTEALCRLIERELMLPPEEIELRNNYASNIDFSAAQWAHYMVFGRPN